MNAYAHSSGTSSDEHVDKGDQHLNVSARALSLLLAQKSRENKRLQKSIQLLASQHTHERTRADEAERRVLELAKSLNTALSDIDNRSRQAETARSELTLYKFQLDAQQRITREAQRTIDDLIADRDRADADAAQARSLARKLKEELAVREAFDKGKEEGIRSGQLQRAQIDKIDQRRREARAAEAEERERQLKREQEKINEGRAKGRAAARVREQEPEQPRRDQAEYARPVDADRHEPLRQQPPHANGPNHQQSTHTRELHRKADISPGHGRVPRGLEDVLFTEVSTVAETPPPAESSPLASSAYTMIDLPSRSASEAVNRAPAAPEPITIFAPYGPFFTTPFRTPRATPYPRPLPELTHRSKSAGQPPLQPIPVHAYPPSQPPPEFIQPAYAVPPRPVIYTPGPPRPPSDRSKPQQFRPELGHRTPSPIATPRLPDGWVPRAQDIEGDGRLSIHLPPPHELVGAVRSETQFDVVSSSEEGGPGTIIPSLPSRSPYAVQAPIPPPPNVYAGPPPQYPGTPGVVLPPPPNVQYMSRTPSAPVPPPPILYNKQTPIPSQSQQRRRAGNESRASTRISEYEIVSTLPSAPPLATVDSDSELEYSDGPTYPIPSAPRQPAYGQSSGRMSTKQTLPPQPTSTESRAQDTQTGRSRSRARSASTNPPTGAPPAFLPAFPPTTRPGRSRTQSSGVIINVESPSPDYSPPAAHGEGAIAQPDLLSPEYVPGALPPIPPSSAPAPPFAGPPRTAPRTISEQERPKPRYRGMYDTIPAVNRAPYPSLPPKPPPKRKIRRSSALRRRAREPADESQSEASGPLSSQASENSSLLPRLAGSLFPRRMPWRRHTVDK